MKNLITLAIILFSLQSIGQGIGITPTVSPAKFTADQSITLTYDVTGTSIEKWTEAWLWLWLPDLGGFNAQSNINPAKPNSAITDKAKMTKSVTNGKHLFKITLKLTDFTGKKVEEIKKVSILIKGNDWRDGKTKDHTIIPEKKTFPPVAISPTVAPAKFTADQSITLTYDVTGTPIEKWTEAWLWLWLPDLGGFNAPSNINPAKPNSAITDKAKMTKSVTNGKHLFKITLKLTDFTGKKVEEIKKVSMLIKGNDWSDGKTKDHTIIPEKKTFHPVAISPTVAPAKFTADQSITLTYDVTGTPMEKWTEAWLWLWLPDLGGFNAPSNINPAKSNSAITDKAKMTKSVANGKHLFKITLKLTDFTGKKVEEIKKVSMLIKGNDWSDGKTKDHTIIPEKKTFPPVAISPTVAPAKFTADQSITLTYDVTGTSIEKWTEAWLWLWLPDLGGFNSPSNINPAKSNPAKTNKAKFAKSVSNGKHLFKITLKLTDFTGKKVEEIKKASLLLKGNDWSDGKTKDHTIIPEKKTFPPVAISPTVSPAKFTADQLITLTYDVTDTPMAKWTEAWLWLWLPDLGGFNSPSNINPAKSNPAKTNKAKFTKSVANGKHLFKITLKLTDFTGKKVEEIKKASLLLKGNDWSDGKTKDHTIIPEKKTFPPVAISPTVSPAKFTADQSITLTYDVTGTPMEKWTEAWLWLWLPDLGGFNSPSNINPAKSNPAKTNKAKFIKSVANGKHLFKITLKLTDFTGKKVEEIKKASLLLKGNDWSDGKTKDHTIIPEKKTFPPVAISPTVSPAKFTADQSITLTYDVTNTPMQNWTEAWLWLWLPDLGGFNAPSNINPAKSNTAITDKAKMTKSVANGKHLFKITLKLTDFIGKKVEEIKKVGVLIKGNDWSDGKSRDFILPVRNNQFSGLPDTPDISPDFFTADEQITITYDVTGTSMHKWDEAWLWLWLPDLDNYDAPSNVNPAKSNPSKTNVAKFTKTVENGKQLFKISLKLTDFLKKPKKDIKKIGMLIKGNTWKDGQSDDYKITLTEGFALKLKSPKGKYGFYNAARDIDIKAITSQESFITISIDGKEVASTNNTLSATFRHKILLDGKVHTISAKATKGSATKTEKYTYTSAPTAQIVALPAGMKEGINYHKDDPTKVTLVLKAPHKNYVFAIGDFNQWQLNNSHLMKKSGDLFWVTIENLTPTQEYIFQYLIDGSILVADPYTDKVSDPWDDKKITDDNYKNLIKYPEGLTKYRASVFQTGQKAFTWKVTNFKAPKKEDLVIYELLVRDFTDKRTYDAVTDKLDYLKKLGINALELMPVNEFEGNKSWGYNPNFYFAPDKFYGTKNSLKKLIDECHQRGIAVILDQVLNHSFNSSPMVRMYWDEISKRPTRNNPWYNTHHNFQNTGAHWGSDFNHESPHTQAFIDSVNHYWVSEYKVDGFRFDFTKGFGNNFKGSDDNWGSKYDRDRIQLLKRMADKIWKYAPNSYMIFEHLAENSEEKELSNHGIMLWGSMNHTYRETAKGGANGLGGVYYKHKGWSKPHLISYMESHDEERVAWEVLKHNDLDQVTKRLKLNAAFFFTIPGPKMLWQFQEMGYDEQLNNNRLAIKPTHWEYLEVPQRKSLYLVYQSLINLKTKKDYFDNQYFKWDGNGAVKWITSSHPDVQIAIVGNFGNSNVSTHAHLSKNGTWYDYFSKKEINVTDFNNHKITLGGGEFKIFTSKAIENYIENETTGIDDIVDDNIEVGDLVVYPNPTSGFLAFRSNKILNNLKINDLQGREHTIKLLGDQTIDTQSLSPGMYVLTGQDQFGKIFSSLFVKE